MNKIERIAQILGITLSSNETEVKLAEATLENGTVIYTESEVFEVGSVVTVAGEDDVMVPVGAGEHVINDGTIIVTDEAGVITEVKVTEEPAEEQEEEELSDEGKEGEEEKVYAEVSPEEKTAIVAEVMQILEPRIAALEEALLKSVEALNSTNKKLTEQVETLSAQPAAEALKPKYKVPTQEENALAAYKRK